MEHMQGKGVGGLHKNLLYVNKEEASVSPAKCSGWSLPPKWMSFKWHHRLHFLVLFNADIILLESVLWAAAVSSGGPGETGGTVRSAGTRTSSRVCSGTERIPERCFGNSGENWSAGGRKGKKGITGGGREWLRVQIHGS